VESLTNVDLPYALGIRDQLTATIVGGFFVVAFLVGGMIAFYYMCKAIKGADFEEFMARWGWARFTITGFLVVNMWALVVKMLLRHLGNIKYVMSLQTTYFSINI
jgi:hypothetical protein